MGNSLSAARCSTVDDSSIERRGEQDEDVQVQVQHNAAQYHGVAQLNAVQST